MCEGLLVKGKTFLAEWWQRDSPAGAVAVQLGEGVVGPRNPAQGVPPLSYREVVIGMSQRNVVWECKS